MATTKVQNSKLKVKRASRKKTEKVETSIADTSSNFSIPGFGGASSPMNKKIPYFIAAGLGVALLVYFLSKFLVIAWVDNKPVTRISLYQNLEKRYGNDAREQLIVETLVGSEAQKRKVSVSNDELNAELLKTQEKYGGADQFNQLIQGQNVTLDEVKKQIRLQLLMNKMFGGSVNISDEEVDKYIQDNGEVLSLEGKEATEVAKIKADTKEELKQQKVNEEIGKWIDETLKGSRVKRV